VVIAREQLHTSAIFPHVKHRVFAPTGNIRLVPISPMRAWRFASLRPNRLPSEAPVFLKSLRQPASKSGAEQLNAAFCALTRSYLSLFSWPSKFATVKRSAGRLSHAMNS